MADESTIDNLDESGTPGDVELADAPPASTTDDTDEDASESDDQLGPSEHTEGESDDESDAGDRELDAEEEPQTEAPAVTTDALEPLRAAARGAVSLPGAAQFFRRILGGLDRSAAGTPALRQTLLPLLREYVREGVSEPEAYPELVELYAEGVDEALPVVTALATRALLRALDRRGRLAPQPPRLDEIVRHAERAARALAQSRGRRALHALPHTLIRAAVPARSRRRFRVPGPVEIVIYAR
jgi:hypothetical protein